MAANSRPVVIVTGAGRGIGASVCGRFAREGFHIVAAARTESELMNTRSSVISHNEKSTDGKPANEVDMCDVIQTDVTLKKDIDALVHQTVEKHEGVQVLVNCAGAAPVLGINELDEDQFNHIMDVNVRGIYHTCRAVWPIMVEQGDGVIINISSMASTDPFPGLTAYGASKAWVNTWTKGLSNEGKAHGIRVYSVAPGAVNTDMLRGAFPDFPLEQALNPTDIANVVYALSTSDCRYASGETVFVQK